MLMANPATRALGAWFQSHLLQTAKLSPLAWRGYITPGNRLSPAGTRGALLKDLLCQRLSDSHRDEIDRTKCKNGKPFVGPHDAFHGLSCIGADDPQYVHRNNLHEAIVAASCQLLKDKSSSCAMANRFL